MASTAVAQMENAIQVTRNGGTSSLESPDGNTLYFTKTTPAFDFSLWRMPARGGAEKKILDSLHRYSFALTDEAVFFATPGSPESPAEIKKLDLATGKVTSLYVLNGRIDLGLTVSPDRGFLLFTQLDGLEAI